MRLRHRPGDDGGGGAAEHQLEEELPPEGHVGGQGVIVEGQVAVPQNEQVLRAHKGVVPAEHQAPAQEQEAQGGHGEDDEVLGEDVHRVFRAGQARLQGGEAQVHKEHQNGRQQDPQGIDNHANQLFSFRFLYVKRRCRGFSQKKKAPGSGIPCPQAPLPE